MTAAELVGRERRECLSQLAWSGGGCFDSRRRVNSTVRRLLVVTGQYRRFRKSNLLLRGMGQSQDTMLTLN